MKTIRIEDKTEMESIIRSCSICMAAVNSPNGFPYLFPMNFAYSDGKIILHSAPEGTHLTHLQADNRITVSFCTDGKIVYQHKDVACSYRMDSKSVICKGRVRFVDDIAEKENILNSFMAHYTGNDFRYSQPALRNVKVWLVDIEEMTARAFGQPHKPTGKAPAM